MAWRSGSLSRTLVSTVRSSSSRLSSSAPQLRPPLTAPRRLPGRHFSAASRFPPLKPASHEYFHLPLFVAI
ncbi:uncharacterized protein E5676_scaffold13G001000 [Cucumis melo var. makuwa]|uniref:Uncharacterized protein n=1 Tax=Cucumis melo var. makuwa TaxID=1194695 RepID=A0A5A7SQD7_CUCMM|nr:uncharacterized protein E6C27_scaffold139G00990 [Cucumis melo var. makuwa]TYK06798.1 uncharacterized protein E5676_scaffold13G001000 [Cucumis melo var. makuwa]